MLQQRFFFFPEGADSSETKVVETESIDSTAFLIQEGG